MFIRALFFFTLSLVLNASAAPILFDSFNYTNGPLVTGSAGKWNTHSGVTGEVAVSSSRLLLKQSSSEDVNALLDGQPYIGTSSHFLYARCIINFSNFPSGTGEYFAHFKSGSVSGFRARIFASTQGATPRTFRIGVANADTVPAAVIPRDLSLNTDYLLVFRYMIRNTQTTVWINPTSEFSLYASDTNSASTLGITSLAFRQSGGIGDLLIDSLAVGMNFSEMLSGLPPIIDFGPTSHIISEGESVRLSVSVTGTAPFSYQWQWNGEDIVGEAGSTLDLDNITRERAGLYGVRVTNSFGSITSDPAVLTVQSLNSSASSGAFSIVHYNVKGNFASDWTTNAPQVQAIARQMQYLNPDIIALNEIPNGLRSEMTNWMKAFFPDYNLAVSPGTDGALRSGVISRFSITRSNSWLDGASLTNFGYDGTFTRDLFEAEIAVPIFPYPLHLFTTHLKSGQGTDESLRRLAEVRAISNYFVTSFLMTNSSHPYLLTGDMNEDIARPPTSNPQSIQTLVSPPIGLHLTTPINPFSGDELTHSIQSPSGMSKRYDYIFPSGILFSNLVMSEVFRTDLVPALPSPLQTNDSALASDHLPVLMVFDNPYTFAFTSMTASNGAVVLEWQTTPGSTYALASSSNLITWTTISTNLASSNTLTFSTNIVADKVFIRAYRNP